MCYCFAGKAIVVCVTEACCHGNEGRYCWQHKGHHVSQDLHTETRKCQVNNIQDLHTET